MSLDIKDIIHGSFDDYSAILAQKSNWMDLDFLDRKLLTYTRPYSETFYNPTGLATFLYHFKKKEWFNFFPILCSRDGLISILHFFYNHPTPEGISTTLILPVSAKNLIPTAWQDQCLFYGIRRHKTEEKIKPESIYISTMVNSDLYSMENIQAKLDLIKKSGLPVKAMFLRHQPLGEETIVTHDNHDFEFFKQVEKTLGDKLTLIDYRGFENADLSRSQFMELNQYNTWYNDSIFTHELLAQGSTPLLNDQYGEEKFDEDSCIRISKYHFYKISKIESKNKKDGAECWDFVNSIPSHVFEGEKDLDRKSQHYHEVFLCTPEFKSLTKNLVQMYSPNDGL